MCAAVQYAHQNLVVHRDLKPGNILVTADGQPKLLDFGIAKIVNPEFTLLDGDPTSPEFRVMTPEYASPEQVRGQPISTASDVYALGVILYELITGRRPYQIKNRVRNEIERVVCSEDPERPSTALTHMPDGAPETDTLETVSRARDTAPGKLRRRVAGDLDNIILKAMRKEPQRRYTSAEALSEDLDRHMRGMPVTARPDTFTYRAGKFVRRHRAAVVVTGVIALLLVGGIVGTASGMQRARQAEVAAVDARDEAVAARQAEADERLRAERERDRADAGFAEAQQMARTLMVDFHDAIAVLDGALPARQLLVETALAYLDKQVEQVGAYPELLADLATAYDRVGDLRGGVRNPSLGDLDGALESYGRARTIWANLVARDEVAPAWWRGLARNDVRLGDVRRKMGEHGPAMDAYRAAQRITERLVARDDTSPAARWDLSSMLINLGSGYVMLGDDASALEVYRRALELREAVVAEHPDDPAYARGLAIVHGRLAGRQHAAGALDDALASHERSIDIRRELVEAAPDSGRAKRDLAMARYGAARVLIDLERPADAMRHLEGSLPDVRARYADNPTSARAQRDLAMYQDLLASLHLDAGDLDAARAQAQGARAAIASLAAAQPDDVNAQYLLASSLLHEGAASATGGCAGARSEGDRHARGRRDAGARGRPHRARARARQPVDGGVAPPRRSTGRCDGPSPVGRGRAARASGNARRRRRTARASRGASRARVRRAGSRPSRPRRFPTSKRQSPRRPTRTRSRTWPRRILPPATPRRRAKRPRTGWRWIRRIPRCARGSNPSPRPPDRRHPVAVETGRCRVHRGPKLVPARPVGIA